MIKLTVFTPTYNRAYTLHKCYESLKKQSCKNFKWLIIDDGSEDNTKELVEKWINEKEVNIKYHYQENQGMHGAHNTAYELIDTELNVCIDSDDYMPENAIEKILEFWDKNKREDIAGIMALDAYTDGKIIGSQFPQTLIESTYFDVYNKYGIKGDKKLIYRTNLIKQNPYPIFEGEKYVGLAYKYARLDEKYKLLLMNEVVCIVEYMQDGSSLNMLRQYRKNPKGFAFIRTQDMKNPKCKLSFKFKAAMHYVSSSIFAKNKKFLQESPCKFITFLSIPFGVILYAYIYLKTTNYS